VCAAHEQLPQHDTTLFWTSVLKKCPDISATPETSKRFRLTLNDRKERPILRGRALLMSTRHRREFL